MRACERAVRIPCACVCAFARSLARSFVRLLVPPLVITGLWVDGYGSGEGILYDERDGGSKGGCISQALGSL